MSGTTRVSRYQKGKTRKVKTNLDLLEQEIVRGSGICWAICKSAPHSRQLCQHPTTQFFVQAGCPSCRPTNSVKALKAIHTSSAVMLDVLWMSWRSMVWLYICVCVGYDREPHKMAELIEMLYGGGETRVLEEPCITWWILQNNQKWHLLIVTLLHLLLVDCELFWC